MKHEAIKLYTAQDSIQAEMIISTLKNSNIPSYKKDLGNGGIMNIYGKNTKIQCYYIFWYHFIMA